MSKSLTRSLSQRKVVSTKLIMGVMVAAVSVLVGTSNIAGATSGRHHGHNNNGHHGVAANAQANAGFGYGSGNVNVDIGSIVGNNNVIVVIVNYFVGH